MSPITGVVRWKRIRLARAERRRVTPSRGNHQFVNNRAKSRVSRNRKAVRSGFCARAISRRP